MPANEENTKSHNNWDIIAERFNTHVALNKIHPDAAVNIYVGWPFFFDQIKYQTEFLGKKHCNIMDFGCGAGDFCVKLNAIGHNVIGVDSSENMLKNARQNSPQEIKYVHCDLSHDKETLGNYKGMMDIVTAIHSLDWVENVEDLLSGLVELLDKDGLLLFAVFSRSHVVDSLKIKDLFEEFDSDCDPQNGVCNFDGVKIPVYIRESAYFDGIMKKLKCFKVLEYYPPFPDVFFKTYKWTGSLFPEMMILGYRKTD